MAYDSYYAPGTINPWSGGVIPQGAQVYSSNGVNVQDYSGVGPSMGNWFSPFNQGGSGPAMSPQMSGAGMPSAGYGMPTNPYLGGQADAIRNQQAQLLDHGLNSIRAHAIGVGGLGGSRQGVAEGVAIGQAATGLDSALSGLFGSNWNADQNRALQQYQGDQGFFSSQRGQDLQQAALGGNLYQLGQQGQWLPYQQYTGTIAPFAGNGTVATSEQKGGGWGGLLGGALGGAQLGWNNGWWGNKPAGT
jgi:hypothetical protein